MNTIDIIAIAIIWSIVAICIGMIIGYRIGTCTIDHELHSQLLVIRRLKDRAEDENKRLERDNIKWNIKKTCSNQYIDSKWHTV